MLMLTLEAITLGRECEILPAAFYASLLQRWSIGAEGGRPHLTTTSQYLRRLISGREPLQDTLTPTISN
jgi:hypothetical protein